MIIIARAKLKFLNSGRTLDIPNPEGRYRKGHVYKLGTKPNKSLCEVEIIATHPDHVTIKLAVEPPLLLAAHSQYGYTHQPSQAMFDEPAAVPPDELPALNRRHQERVAAKAQIINLLDHLAVDATATENRRLRNARRAASSL